MRYRREVLVGLLALGLALRLAALPLAGATDAPIFALWADTASAEGVGAIYGTGGVFPERRLLARDGVLTKVNYPPLLLYEFAAARAVRMPLKGLSVVSDTALTLLLWLALRRRTAGPRGASFAALGYWINPAAVLTGSVLGYVEPLLALPATAAVIAAASGWPFAAGALLAAAVLTKQLAVLAAPATLLALRVLPSATAAARLARVAAGAGLVAIAVCWQVAWNGGALNMAWSLGAPLRDPFLSGDAANLWWLVAAARAPWPLDVLRVVGAALTIGAIGWSIAIAPRDVDLWLAAAAGGFAFHAHHALAVSVHEPHLFPAVPLLALACAGRRAFLTPLLTVSAVSAVNVLRIPGLPMTLLAAANCLALAWHARIYATECARAARDRCPSTID